MYTSRHKNSKIRRMRTQRIKTKGLRNKEEEKKKKKEKKKLRRE